MNKLDKQFETAKVKPGIDRASLTPAKTERPDTTKPNALSKRQRGQLRTKRASFEITTDLETRLIGHLDRTGFKKSQVIRQAIDNYLKQQGD